MEALRTATYNPARYLGLLDSQGTTEAGKIADLVLLDANPLESITDPRRINAVILNGRYVPEKHYRTMLAAVEVAAN